MQTVLFHSTIFGPIHSRRLGVSLGINLMPDNGKICSFDCLYCEAGFNAQGHGDGVIVPHEEVKRMLSEKLAAMHAENHPLDVITFSGNGEPTLHPDFDLVVDHTLALRDRFYPNARVSVLSNSTMAHRPRVRAALLRVDNNILKLDSAITGTLRQINRPLAPDFTAEHVIETLAGYNGKLIVQTMMLSGEYDGKTFDNTTDTEIDALADAYRRIQPREVMLYSLDRETPAKTLTKIPIERLREIGQHIEQATGIKVQVN